LRFSKEKGGPVEEPAFNTGTVIANFSAVWAEPAGSMFRADEFVGSYSHAEESKATQSDPAGKSAAYGIYS
jgi:hypothetical protein